MGFRELHYKLLSNCVVLVWCFPKASFNLPPFYLGEISSSPSSTKNDCNSPCFKAEIYHRKKARQRLGTQAEPHRKWVHEICTRSEIAHLFMGQTFILFQVRVSKPWGLSLTFQNKAHRRWKTTF